MWEGVWEQVWTSGNKCGQVWGEGEGGRVPLCRVKKVSGEGGVRVWTSMNGCEGVWGCMESVGGVWGSVGEVWE